MTHTRLLLFDVFGTIADWHTSIAEAVMIATHQSDLDAAASHGLRTAYIERPHKYGRDQPKTASAPEQDDHHAHDLLALAEQLSG